MNMTIRMLGAASAICLLSGPALAKGELSCSAALANAESTFKDVAAQSGDIGSSFQFARDGKPLKTAFYGYADKETKRPVDRNTLFHWASITKTFTAVAFMQLRERGLVRLDDKVIDYLPEARKIHNPFGSMADVTLGELLSHSSGLRSPTFPWGGTAPWQPHEPASWAQVEAMMPYTHIEFGPGSKYAYSNLGSSMIGRVVEIVSGDTIEEYVTKNILMPLDMRRSYFDTTPYFLRADRSASYVINKGDATAQGFEVETGATNGNGGLNGPVEDMQKWLNFLLGAGDNGNYNTVLSRASLAEMWTPEFQTNDKSVNEKMGKHFFIIDEPSSTGKMQRFIGHTGSQMGYRAFIYIEPVGGTSAIFVTNSAAEDVKIGDQPSRVVRRKIFTEAFPACGRSR